MSTLEKFKAKFVEAAHARLRRALGALQAEPAVVASELHSLAGEAGMLGLVEISRTAAKGNELTGAWRTSTPTNEQRLAVARILRGLLGLVDKLTAVPAPRASSPVIGPRALVVDDSELAGEELAFALRQAGFDATHASDAEGVAVRMREAPPDVVLIDANIPGVDVRALCDHIREHARHAKLLVVSASSDDELRSYTKEFGADGYVGKLHGSAPVVERVKAAVAEPPT